MPPAKIVIDSSQPRFTRILKALIQSSLEAADSGKAMKKSIIRASLKTPDNLCGICDTTDLRRIAHVATQPTQFF